MNSYRLLLLDVARSLRWRMPVLIVLMALVGLTEGLSIALLLPLLTRLGIDAGGGQGSAAAMLNRWIEWVSPSVDPVSILALVIGVAIVQAVLFILLNYWTSRLARRYQRERQSQMFAAFIRARWTFLVDRKSGELASAIISESDRLAQAFWSSLYLISASIVALIYLAFALLVAWPVTVSLIGFAMVVTLLMTQIYRKSFAVGRSIAPLNAELQTALNELLGGAKIVKATTSESRAEARVDGLVQKLERANTLAYFLPSMVRGLFEFLAFIFLATVFVFGREGLGVAPGNIIVVLALFVRLFPRVTTVQVYIHSLNGQLHAIETILRLLNSAQGQAERSTISHERLAIDFPTRLTVRGLDVTLGGRKVLDQIDLVIPIPGMVGVVGGSGAGKSTLVHALLGLVPANGGSISLGPHDLATASLGSWRRTIGYVPQETMLFHASVRDNLTLANPEASRAEIEAAARRAHAHGFISDLPQGYDTVIGDQGVKLSGGQRQRLGITRALLAHPLLLLLDEAMSALDAESEAEILASLEELRQQMGILVIAHRLAAVRKADAVCVLEAGRVVEFGRWNELIVRQTRLRALAQAQHTG